MPSRHPHGVTHAHTSATVVLVDVDLDLVDDPSWSPPWIGVVGAMLLVIHDDALADAVVTSRWCVRDGGVRIDSATDETRGCEPRGVRRRA